MEEVRMSKFKQLDQVVYAYKDEMNKFTQMALLNSPRLSIGPFLSLKNPELSTRRRKNGIERIHLFYYNVVSLKPYNAQGEGVKVCEYIILKKINNYEKMFNFSMWLYTIICDDYT